MYEMGSACECTFEDNNYVITEDEYERVRDEGVKKFIRDVMKIKGGCSKKMEKVNSYLRY